MAIGNLVVTEVHPGKDGLVGTVTIRTQEGVVIRPVTKVASLEKIGRWSGNVGEVGED